MIKFVPSLTKLVHFSIRVVAIASILGFLCAEAAAAERNSSQPVGYAPQTASLSDAAGLQSALKVYEKAHGFSDWSRVIMVYMKDAKQNVRAHAYCLFILDGKVWAYDQVSGSQRAFIASTDKEDPAKIGKTLAAQNFIRATWADKTL